MRVWYTRIETHVGWPGPLTGTPMRARHFRPAGDLEAELAGRVAGDKAGDGIPDQAALQRLVDIGVLECPIPYVYFHRLVFADRVHGTN